MSESEAHTSAGCVLIVEDDPISRVLLAEMLHNRGYDSEVAADGLEALEKLSASEFAAVLMDCRMPRMNGFEATAELRRREGDTRRTPVIAVTANEDLAGCLAAGMDAHLPKPVSPEALDAALARWVPRKPTTSGRLVEAAR